MAQRRLKTTKKSIPLGKKPRGMFVRSPGKSPEAEWDLSFLSKYGIILKHLP